MKEKAWYRPASCFLHLVIQLQSLTSRGGRAKTGTDEALGPRAIIFGNIRCPMVEDEGARPKPDA